ncbi:MAG: glutamate synthase subunit alpha, partial [Chloroflexi bacterium]|nr:glutamate synthase subunit alpha [Chloroflexota bacterium]
MAKLTSTANRRHPGLWDPAFEHANCGVGAIADLKGRRTHGLVSDALTILENLAHRGAKNADPLTGDGSGILLPISDEFFRPSAKAVGINLPPAGRYGVGSVFLPAEEAEADACRDLVAEVALERGQKILGWRQVPIRRGHLGRLARERLPGIEQVFIALPDAQLADPDVAERQLFITRKLVEARAGRLGLTDPETFFVCSLSVLTTVYKGMLISTQTRRFFPDLDDPRMLAQFAIVHSRFSTNTLGSWRLAHPYRMTVHNGEINTFRGNVNWMAAREAVLDHPDYRDLGDELFPIVTPNSSDTAAFDNVVELLVRSGRPLTQAMLMMVPEAWERHASIPPQMRDFYRYHACLMEPWDGPALLVTTDGRRIAALLDRNGFRPFRYTETWDGRLVLASETGVLDLDIANERSRGRLDPGHTLAL